MVNELVEIHDARFLFRLRCYLLGKTGRIEIHAQYSCFLTRGQISFLALSSLLATSKSTDEILFFRWEKVHLR